MVQASGEFSTQFYLCRQCLTICSEFSVFLKLSLCPPLYQATCSHSGLLSYLGHISTLTCDHLWLLLPLPILWIGLGARRACPGVRASLESGAGIIIFNLLQHLRWVCPNRWWYRVPHPYLLASTLWPLITMLCLTSITFWYIQCPHSLTQNNEQGIWSAKTEKNCRKSPRSHHPDVRIFGAEYKMGSAVRIKGLARAESGCFPGNPGHGTKSQRFRSLGRKHPLCLATHPHHCSGWVPGPGKLKSVLFYNTCLVFSALHDLCLLTMLFMVITSTVNFPHSMGAWGLIKAHSDYFRLFSNL